MALALFDRVQETSTTAGTGSIILAGAVSGFQSFAVVGNGNTCYYTIVDGSAWEVGVGTYSTSGPTLARTTILSNSNGNTSPLTLTANSKSVFLTYPASKSVNLNESGNVSPLGTVVSGIWNGTTIGVAYGGTGVTASSGANSVVLRDANQNVAVNRVNQANTNTTAAGGTTALTAASSYIHTLVGTGGQTYTLPDATTLTTGVAFVFNNLATGTLTIANYAGTTIGTIPSGGAGAVFLTLNSAVGGTWDLHAYLPEGVTFGTNAFNLGTSIISGGTWQGGTIATGYGGTGLTSYTSGGAVYANSSSTLTSGTLPLTAGGTAATSAAGARTSLDVPSTTGSGASGTWGINITGSASGSAGSVANAATFNSGGAGDASGTTFNGSAARTISYNTIGAPSTTGTNASGTWSINVTGSAGSSSYATYVYSQDIRTLSPSSTSAYRMGFGFTSWANNNSSPYADYLALRSYSDASGGNDNLVMFNKSTIAMRVWQQSFGSASAYSSYADVLMSNNFNSYAPTLTGGGASGTWAINITGSAGSAPGYLPLSGGTMTGPIGRSTSVAGWFQGTYNNVGDNSTKSNPIYTIGSSYNPSDTSLSNMYGVGWSHPNFFGSGRGSGWGLYTASAGTFTGVFGAEGGFNTWINGYGVSTASWRAPIFYDNDNTAYYLDPASTSNLNSTISQAFRVGSDSAWKIRGNSGNAELAFEYSTSSTLSDANIKAYLTGGTFIVTGDVRAPIFYDSADTGYYLDPNSSSELAIVRLYGNDNQLRINTITNGASGIFFQEASANKWEFYHYQGQFRFYNYTTNQQEAFFDNSGGYFQSRTSVRAPIFYDSNDTGYYVDPAGTSLSASLNGPIVMSSTAWTGEVSGKIQYHGSSWYLVASSYFHFRNTSGVNTFYGDPSGNTWSETSSRAPTFYDSQNTAYYGDFASTSVLNSLNVAGSISSTNGNGIIRLYGNLHIDAYNSNDIYLNYYSGRRLQVFRSSQVETFRTDLDGIVYAYSQFRTPIVYDYNDTSYYVDPASTSQLSTVYAAGNIRGSNGVTAAAASISSGYGGFAGTPSNGYLITTNINYNVFNMPTVIVEGYAYGSGVPIHIEIVWYSYNNGFVSYSYTNLGAWDPGTVRIGTNGSDKICIHFSNNIYYGRMNVRAVYDQSPDYLLNWSVQQDVSYSGLSRVTVVGAQQTVGGINTVQSCYMPIMYDVNNTAYYVDPASGSRMGGINADSLYSYGNVTAYSDERLKTDWEVLPEDFVEKLAKVKSGTYTRIDSGERQVGVGAQSLQVILKEAVSDSQEYLGVNYGNAALASAVELAKYVTALEQRISQLEARL